MIDRSPSIARLQFLGTQRIEIGSEVVTPEAERLFGMIVRLSVPLGRITSRQTMLDTLWPGADDANARHNLRQTVYKAREIGLVVESGEDGIRLDPRHWSCDWDDPVGDVGGEWLAGYEPGFSEQLTAWITAQRVGVHALVRPRIIRSLQTARSAGELVVADRYARQLLGIDELNEEATLTCAELMAMQGAKVDALKLLDAYLVEIGRVGSGKDAALPAQLLRRRIAEKLPAIAYHHGSKHHGPLVGRQRESKRLFAALVDARAGRGGGILLQGGDGTGKSRLLYETRKSAVLQGMQVLEMACDSLPSVLPFANLRSMIARLLAYPGAMGVSPEALATLQAWIVSNEFAPDDCPLSEIEDLLAAIADETPLLLLVEHAERMDRESLGRLDRVYRRGVSRYHMMVLTSSTLATPTESPVDVQWLERLALRPMHLVDVRSVVTAYASAEQPRATPDQIACAAVFAEGVPMYGIEMLGLMLDEGSPDVVPWRVQTAVDRAVRELTELQLRVLLISRSLRRSSTHGAIAHALDVDASQLVSAIDSLETIGYLQCEHGVLRPSELMSTEAHKRIRANQVRQDASRAASAFLRLGPDELEPNDFYTCLRLIAIAREEARACTLIDDYAGAIVRRDTAQNIEYELGSIRKLASSALLGALIDSVLAQVTAGSGNDRSKRQRTRSSVKPISLPSISPEFQESEYTFSSSESLTTTLADSRDPNLTPHERLAEAVAALFVAFNRNDKEAMIAACQAVNAVRYSPDASAFDIHRADLISASFFGDRNRALESAQLLASESRLVRNVELACTGLRNAAEASAVFGDPHRAQSLLLESRSLADGLDYHLQTVRADLNLANLCLDAMDVDGARAYLNSADARCARYSLHAPLLTGDRNLFRCWEWLIRGDLPRAQKAARIVSRTFQGPLTGTPLWARLSVELATHRGTPKREALRGFETLRSSIGSRSFYAEEQMSLAALMIFSRNTSVFPEIASFTRNQFARIEANGRSIWPFLLMQLE